MKTIKGLARDTLIATNMGTLPIPYVTAEHSVKTPTGYSKVKSVSELGSHRVIAFDTINDLPLVATADTAVFTGPDTFTTMKSISPRQNLLGSLAVSQQTGAALNFPDHFKINTEEKKVLLFSILGCMMLHKPEGEEELILSAPYCIATFRDAVGELFRWPAAEKKYHSSIRFDYSEVPVMTSMTERYQLCTSLDNVVQNLVLPASMECKAAFLKSFVANMTRATRWIEVNITNWILRRQLQVLFAEFGIHCLVHNDNLRISSMFYSEVAKHIGFVDQLKELQKSEPMEIEQDMKVRAIDNSGYSDIFQISVESGEPFLANTIFVKTE